MAKLRYEGQAVDYFTNHFYSINIYRPFCVLTQSFTNHVDPLPPPASWVGADRLSGIPYSIQGLTFSIFSLHNQNLLTNMTSGENLSQWGSNVTEHSRWMVHS